MSLEMAHKVMVPPKKNYIPQFLKQRDINSYLIRTHIVGTRTYSVPIQMYQRSQLHTRIWTGMFNFVNGPCTQTFTYVLVFRRWLITKNSKGGYRICAYIRSKIGTIIQVKRAKIYRLNNPCIQFHYSGELKVIWMITFLQDLFSGQECALRWRLFFIFWETSGFWSFEPRELP